MAPLARRLAGFFILIVCNHSAGKSLDICRFARLPPIYKLGDNYASQKES
jgi:hypothetical protein